MAPYQPLPFCCEVYRGFSKHPLLSQQPEILHSVEFVSVATRKSVFERIFRKQKDLRGHFTRLIWALSEFGKGQTLIAEVRPEPAYWVDDQEFGQLVRWLEKQVIQAQHSGSRVRHAIENKKATGGPYRDQFIFQISKEEQLDFVLQNFLKHEMVNFFIYYSGVHLRDAIKHLHNWFVEKPFATDAIFDSLNACCYGHPFGDALIIETKRYKFLDRFLSENHIEPVPIPQHPLDLVRTKHSLWINKRRIVP